MWGISARCSNGAFYVILLTNNEKEGACYKATDPTVSWSVQDVNNSPDGEDTIPSAAMRLSPDGKRIGVVTQQSNESVHWSEFIDVHAAVYDDGGVVKYNELVL